MYKVRTYTTNVEWEVLELIVKSLEKWCPEHEPAMTSVGVASLFKGMKIEIEVTAHVGS